MFEQAFKNVDDVLWKEARSTSELDYTEQTSWLLFLKYLDGLEQGLADEAAERLFAPYKQKCSALESLKKSLLFEAFGSRI